MFSQIGDQNMWNDHSSNECVISFCGGMTRAWEEGMIEIEDLKKICVAYWRKAAMKNFLTSTLSKYFMAKIPSCIEFFMTS